MITGVGAIWNVLRPSPEMTVAVAGSGAVGLSALMALTMTPATRIIAVDRVASRLTLACELGATDVLDTSTEDLKSGLLRLTEGAGVDAVIETTGRTELLRAGLDALAAQGTVVVIGAPPFGTEVSIEVSSLLAGRKIVGVTLGDVQPSTLIPLLVRHVRSGRLRLDRLITTYPYDKIADAVHDSLEGRTIKPVLLFE